MALRSWRLGFNALALFRAKFAWVDDLPCFLWQVYRAVDWRWKGGCARACRDMGCPIVVNRADALGRDGGVCTAGGVS